jgi:predicted cobalt transporter CbtA
MELVGEVVGVELIVMPAGAGAPQPPRSSTPAREIPQISN